MAIAAAKMGKAFRPLIAGASLLAALGLALPAAAQSTRTTQHEAGASHPHVYLMRGLLNVFSLGMDQLAAQIEQKGIDASVYNHSVADTVVDRIVRAYRGGDRGPFILVGHSLGADAAMTMAQQLNLQGVPVALVVPFDGTGSYAAPGNVACVLNLTQRKYAYMQAGAGFHGKLSNVDVSGDGSIDHFTIDKTPRLQAQALSSILQAARGQSCRPGTNGPVVAKPKEPLPPKLASPAKETLPATSVSSTSTKSTPSTERLRRGTEG
ncbi:MAG TPA: thioesterase domain-containing protein [Xanthobacteraceae bacterium]|nr:thioesterase domain-containing protein [Xanthobacteraceae bacterium]